MKTRPLYDFLAEDFQITPLNAAGLLDQENDLYDDNWIVSAHDLFGKMELPTTEYNPYQNLAA